MPFGLQLMNLVNTISVRFDDMPVWLAKNKTLNSSVEISDMCPCTGDPLS